MYSLMNIGAVRRVVKANPDIFPAEALTHTRTWLSQNRQAWCAHAEENLKKPKPVIIKRYGLLSGYPRRAVERHPSQPKISLSTGPVSKRFTSNEIGLIMARQLRFAPMSRADKDNLRGVLQAKAADLLTKREIDAFVEAEQPSSRIVPRFWTYNDGDKIWFENLEKIFTAAARKTGIDRLLDEDHLVSAADEANAAAKLRAEALPDARLADKVAVILSDKSGASAIGHITSDLVENKGFNIANVRSVVVSDDVLEGNPSAIDDLVKEANAAGVNLVINNIGIVPQGLSFRLQSRGIPILSAEELGELDARQLFERIQAAAVGASV
jgi:hypothetical protein